MSARAASLGFLVAFEAKLAWRRVAGERRRIAIAALLLFWLGLHAAAFNGLAGLRTDAFARVPVAAFDDVLATIANHPTAWATWQWGAAIEPPLRHFVMPRFPYVIGYQVTADAVVVSHVVHGRRRPGRR